AENARQYGGRDEGHGRWRQARPDGGSRQYARPRRRHAVARANAEDGREDAGRPGARNIRRRRRPAADHAWPAAEIPRRAPGPRRAKAAGTWWASGIREEEMNANFTLGAILPVSSRTRRRRDPGPMLPGA